MPITREDTLTANQTSVARRELPLRPKRLTTEEQVKHREMVVGTAFQRETVDYDDLLPYRLRTCYRLVREFARHRGLVADDETLAEALSPLPTNPDPWTIPEETSLPAIGNYSRVAIDHMERAERFDERHMIQKFDQDNKKWVCFPGLALLPPEVPVHYLSDTGYPKEDYTLEGDHMLCQYVKVLDALAMNIYADQGALGDPDAGRFGLEGVLHYSTVRRVFPSRLQLVMWEEMLIEESLSLLIDKGVTIARRTLYDKYGMQPWETNAMMKMSRVRARQAVEGDVEEDRGVMLLRIESFIERAKSGLDLRAEMAGLKQLSLVLGLAKNHETDVLQDFFDVVRAVGEERKTLESPPEAPKRLDVVSEG